MYCKYSYSYLDINTSIIENTMIILEKSGRMNKCNTDKHCVYTAYGFRIGVE